mmetsp:Transcript_6693/g.9259  ORF Transcript_6693/g.9259 Transcript_6693/m.9259 type:complete len:128 (+) Transcript_6693:54-437(+)
MAPSAKQPKVVVAQSNLPDATNSALRAALLFLVTLLLMQVFASTLASSAQLTIVGGFVSSLLFVFGLLFIGNLKSETKWFEVILCELISLAAASSVHRVCVTTCFLFSAAELFYLNQVSKKIYQRGA